MFVTVATSCSSETERTTESSAIEANGSIASNATDDLSSDLPSPVVSRDQIAAWLETTGANFAEVRRIGGDLTGETAATVQECEGWVAQLGAGPAPSDLVDTASTAPDPVLADALAQTVLSVNRALSRCTAGQPVDADTQAAIVGGLSVIDEREAGR